jgi:hypothetical protein
VSELSEPDLRLEGFRLWVHGYEFPDSADHWDASWLNVTAQVEASGARVEAQGPFLRTDELAAFAGEVKALHASLVGSAVLRCLEPQLQIVLEGDGLGHIAVTVDLTADHMNQSHSSRFGSDQTWLPPLVAACEAVLQRYPTRGSPPG